MHMRNPRIISADDRTHGPQGGTGAFLNTSVYLGNRDEEQKNERELASLIRHRTPNKKQSHS